jgi:predicted transcriptional regulator
MDLDLTPINAGIMDLSMRCIHSMASKTTTIVPVRVENELVARLDALAGRQEGTNRTALAREALRRGVELMEAELAEPSTPREAPAAASQGRPAAEPKSLDAAAAAEGGLAV